MKTLPLLYSTGLQVPALILLAFTSLACTGSSEAPGPGATVTEERPSAVSPAVPKHVRWVRGSAEHRAIILQIYNLATARVEKLAQGREPGSWAVIMDVDETVIDNSLSEYELTRSGTPFSEAIFRAWVERKEAIPLPGALGFMNRVHALGGKIALVTNRSEESCPATEENLLMYDFPFDVLLCREGEERDKNPRWQRVAAGEASPGLGPLEIVMWVGDRMIDFPGFDQSHLRAPEEDFTLFGDRYFIFPNPMYGSWESTSLE